MAKFLKKRKNAETGKMQVLFRAETEYEFKVRLSDNEERLKVLDELFDDALTLFGNPKYGKFTVMMTEPDENGIQYESFTKVTFDLLIHFFGQYYEIVNDIAYTMQEKCKAHENDVLPHLRYTYYHLKMKAAKHIGLIK